MRSVSRAALAAAMALLVLGAYAGAAAAASPAPVTPGSRYLALGDSVTFGYQESQVVPAPNYHNAASFLGYPEQLATALHLKVANAACPGETSDSLLNPSAQSNGCENTNPAETQAYRKLYPLHVSYKGSQIAYAVSYLRAHRDVRLVSLMIGANDLFLCQETSKDSCLSASEQKAVFAKVAKNTRTILAAIRNRAHYGGQLVILNYYSLDYTSPLFGAVIPALNRAQDASAGHFHAAVANGYSELKVASVHFGGKPCVAGLLNVVGPGKCGVHPSYAGQALLAQAVEKAVKF
jgi:lysophospholipase L1-like esterase